MKIVTVLVLALLCFTATANASLSSSLCTTSWFESTLVRITTGEPGAPVTHLYQDSDSPVDCTDTFNPTHCHVYTCNIVIDAGLSCLSAPIGSCLSFQVRACPKDGGGVVRYIEQSSATPCQ